MLRYSESSLTKSRAAHRWLLVAGLCLSFATLKWTPLSTAEQAKSDRDYELGPLTKDDFTGMPPPANRQLIAFTTSDIRYDYRYRFQQMPGRVVIRLTEIELKAFVSREKSWLRKTLDERLLDHEQGHFDISYIHALRERIHFAKLERQRRSPTATAENAAAAIEQLRKLIDDHMAAVYKRLYDEQVAYDKATNHGLLPDQQAEHRRQHQQTIQTLLEEWKQFAD